MKKKPKKKKSDQKFSAWLKKNRYPVIAALLVTIVGSVIAGLLTGFFPSLWDLIGGNHNNDIRTILNKVEDSSMQFNFFIEYPESPVILGFYEYEIQDDFLCRAKELIDNDSSETALNLLTPMESRYKDNALYYHILSSAYSQTNKFGIALEYINKSIQIDDNREWAFLLRSSLFSTMGNVEKALDDIKIAIYMNRENPTTWILYGLAVLQKWDVNSAEVFSDSALHYNADLNQYYNLKRFINVIAKDYKKALAYDDSLSSIRKEGKRKALEFDLKARIYASNGRYPEALDFIDSGLSVDNTNADSWDLKALIYLRIGASIPQSFYESNMDSLDYIHKQAMSAADSALYYDKNNTYAMFHKGASLLLLGYPEKAIVFLERAIELDSAYSDARRILEFARDYKGKIILGRAILDDSS